MTITGTSIKEEPSINWRISLYHRNIDSGELADFNLYTQLRKTGRRRCRAILRSCAPTIPRYNPLVTQDLSFYEITPSNVNPFCATSPLRALVKIIHCASRVTHFSPVPPAAVDYPAFRSVKRLGAWHPFVPWRAKEFVARRIGARSNLPGYFSPVSAV